ncbi:MAG: GUN4 domain-containing protein [Cyanobacteria bacterium P01_F01_bin.143]
MRSRSRSASAIRGLAPVQSARGTLISFATAPGEFAEDGGGKNSPFTANLLKHIKTPNLPVELMFKRVRAGVEQETNREQTPWEQSSLVGEFSFFPRQEQPTPSPQTNTDFSTATVTQPTSPIIDSSKPGTILISKATGVNYSQLRDLLVAKEWKEADQETLDRMLQAAGREQEGWFRSEDLNQFSCEDLRIIDRLWLDASQGKFGFIVQKEIWQNNGSPTFDSPTEIWRQFYIDVGWKTEESGIESRDGYVSYDDLGGFTVGVTSKKGNLPATGELPTSGNGYLMLFGEAVFFSRLANCSP